MLCAAITEAKLQLKSVFPPRDKDQVPALENSFSEIAEHILDRPHPASAAPLHLTAVSRCVLMRPPLPVLRMHQRMKEARG